MSGHHDYSLTIAQVSQRLNKSIRTIHRYKDSGRLSYRVGTTQGNPLYFSKSEVEKLAAELYPHLENGNGDGAADPARQARLARAMQAIALYDRLTFAPDGNGNGDGHHDGEQRLSQEFREMLQAELDGKPIDHETFGDALIKLGKRMKAQGAVKKGSG